MSDPKSTAAEIRVDGKGFLQRLANSRRHIAARWESLSKLWHWVLGIIGLALTAALFVVLAAPAYIATYGAARFRDVLLGELDPYTIFAAVGFLLAVIIVLKYPLLRRRAAWAILLVGLIEILLWLGSDITAGRLVVGMLAPSNTPTPPSTSTPPILPTHTPYPSNTPYPTSTPYPTYTPYPSFTPTPTEAAVLWLSDSFGDGELDTNKWDTPTCSSEYARERIGHFYFSIAAAEASCFLQPKVEDFSIERVDFTMTLKNGGAGQGWAGLFTACGQSEVNVILTSDSARYFGDGVDLKKIEQYDTIPVTRRFTVEWTGSMLLIRLHRLVDVVSIECSSTPKKFRFGAGTSAGGAVDAEIDSVQIWGFFQN